MLLLLVGAPLIALRLRPATASRSGDWGLGSSSWRCGCSRPRAFASPQSGVYLFFRAVRLRGTFAPALRASDRPMAMACLRFLTFLPDRPLRSVPAFLSCIARFTF